MSVYGECEKTWKILEHAIHEIYNHNASGLSFEELYRSASIPCPMHPFLSRVVLVMYCLLCSNFSLF